MILSCWIGDLTGSHILSPSHTTNQVISETSKMMFIIFQCFSPIFHLGSSYVPIIWSVPFATSRLKLNSWLRRRKPLGVWSSSLGMASASWRGSSHLGLRYWSWPSWLRDECRHRGECWNTSRDSWSRFRDSWIPRLTNCDKESCNYNIYS